MSGQDRWQPLGVRAGWRKPAPAEPHEGVPAHLAGHLQRWLYATVMDRGGADPDELLGAVSLRLHLTLTDSSVVARPGSPPAMFRADTAMGELRRRCDEHEELFLDVVDAVLRLLSERVPRGTDNFAGYRNGRVEKLSWLLAEAGSAGTVTADGSGLERRVAPGVKEAAMAAAEYAAREANPSASDHLLEAWSKVYGRHPDPTKAYSEAVKSVEAAALRVVLPKDAQGTLGRAIGQLRESQNGWMLAIGESGIGPLLGMLELLWRGQRDRHGGTEPTVPVGLGEAEMAVHLAATLVQWFAAGRITRRQGAS